MSTGSDKAEGTTPAHPQGQAAHRSSPLCDPAPIPDGDHGDHDERKDHLHVGQGAHAKGTEQQQLQDLQACEVVDLPLRHPPDVVGGWV